MGYREDFKRHYGIKFGKEYDVHHIDLNHNNNSIENLMVLPKKLHNKYHFLFNSVHSSSENIFGKKFNAQIHSNIINGDNYNLQMAKELIDTLYECNKWYDYKLYLDGVIPNIHNIDLTKKRRCA